MVKFSVGGRVDGEVGGEDKVKFLVEQMRSWEKHCQTPPLSCLTPLHSISTGKWG